MIIDGRSIAADILQNARKEIAMLGREVILRAVVMKPNAATESYLRMKTARAQDAGMRLELLKVDDTATPAEIDAVINAPGADAVLVQLPLPDTIDTATIVNTIPAEKDADVLSSVAYEKFENGSIDALLPPVVDAIREVLIRANIDVSGKNTVVIGSGKLVGRPAATWLSQQGAMVTVVTRTSPDYESLKTADIIVSGAGSPHLITPDMIKEGVVLIDAGTSESNGALAGDADPACAGLCSVFTPVPGGIGPIAVACLFKNAATLALHAQ